MARSQAVARSATKEAPAKSHKRQRSNATTPKTATPSTRSSKRIKESADATPTNKATPTKSKYFEQSESELDDDDKEEEPSESGFEDEDTSETEASEAATDTDDFDSEDDVRKRKKPGRKLKGATPKSDGLVQNKDLWREGVKTGLGPGKQVFIPKPKARGDGGIKYLPDRIHPNTMEFLKDLKKNNDRQWLKAHDADYRQSWKDFESFVETLTEKIGEVDDTVPELPPKDVVFRIYRDIRFSSDPTPYKPHFSAAWSRTGRKGPYACYYIHIQPGEKCFLGAGLWHPEAASIALIRDDIDRHPERIRGVLSAPAMRKHIFGGIPNDEKKSVKAFTTQNAESALKTKPKGFEADHPNIELLRLKNFTVGNNISDTDIIGPQGIKRIIELVRTVHPFITYLNSVVMPDDNDNDLENNSNSDSGPEGQDTGSE